MRNRLSACMLAFTLLAASSWMFGQANTTSSLQGTVLDKTGAAIVGAQVTVSSPETGFNRTVKTASDGSYRVDPLPVGHYNIKVTMAGFATQTAGNVETLVNTATTQNFSLGVGEASQSVEVTAEAPVIDATKTDVSQTITPREVTELPLIGRDIADLAYLAPGVKAADSYDPTKNRYAILSVNGEGGRNVNVTINGIDNKDNTVGGPVMQVAAEAVQEFAISTQRFSAVNGRSEGAAINVITKSGSNGFHGSAFGFFRDQALNADQKLPDPANNTFTFVNPPYSRQWFGGSVGGPIKKDKVFAFFAMERQREHTSIAEDPQALAQLQLVTSLGAQPAAVVPTPFFENRIDGRMDFTINDHHSAYVHVDTQGNDSLNDQSNGTFDLTEGNFTVNHMQIANLTLNSVLNPTLVNQATVGFSYWNNLIDSKTRTPLVTFPSAQFGTNTNVPQQSFQRKWQFKDDVSKTVGNHTFKTGFDYIYNPSLGGYFEFSPTLEIDFADNPSCILGVGADAGNAKCGAAVYPNKFATPGAVVGMTIANGDPSETLPNGTKQIGLYFQDDWKVLRRLTLNLGVRWDKDMDMVGGVDVTGSRTYQELAAISSTNPLAALFTRKKATDDNRDFSPRVGFAYDVTGSGKHVIRGGYGLYYGDIFQNIPLFMEQQSNPTIFQTVFSLGPSDNVPGTNTPLSNWRYGVDPMPTIAPPSPNLATGTPSSPGATGRLMDPNYRNPVSEEWNGGYAWSVGTKSVVEVEYVHVLGLHENKTINIDPRIPINPSNITTTGVTEDPKTGAPICSPTSCGFYRPFDQGFLTAGLPLLGSVRDEESINRSRYDGLNFSYRQRAIRNVSLVANYTLARALSYDGGGGSFRNYPRDPQHPLSPFELGPSFNDERHHVTIGGIWNMPWGMEFAPVLQFGSARPYNPISSYNQINLSGGSAAGALIVPNGSTNLFNFVGTSKATKLAAYQCYYSGNCHIDPYDSLRGDPYFDMDARIAKNIKLGESRNLQLAFQAFNLFNHANYGNNFDNVIQDQGSTFARPVGFINPTSSTIPRSFVGEFGARFSF